MTFIDVVIITCVSINMIIGYRKGFIWTVMGLSSYLIAALFSKWFYKDLAAWIQNSTGVFIKLQNFIEENFYSFFQGDSINPVGAEEGQFEGMGVVSEFLLKNADVQNYAHQTAEVIKEEIVKGITTLLLNIISMVLIFIVVKGAVLIIGMIIDQVFKLPVLRTFNKTGGILVGGIKGFILVMAVFMIMFVFSVVAPEGKMAMGIENSLILQFFFEDLFPPLLNWLL